MKTEFIKIEDKRYRLSSIKMYEPAFLEKKNKPFAIYIYFSTLNKVIRDYHYFETEQKRDDLITKLDEVFNTKY